MGRVCNKCKDTKSLDEFTKCKPCSSGYRNTCKICTRNYMVKYKGVNLEKLSDYAKEYRKKNSDNNKEYLKVYNTKSEVKKKKTEWYEENKHWLEKTEHRRQYRYEYNKNSITHKWRMVLRNSLIRLDKSKEGKTIDILGYSATDLKVHLESLFTDGMTWDNHGEWHIDHIKPVSSFDKDTQPSVVNSLTNLQPLWATTREINGVVYEGNLNKSNNH